MMAVADVANFRSRSHDWFVRPHGRRRAALSFRAKARAHFHSPCPTAKWWVGRETRIKITRERSWLAVKHHRMQSARAGHSRYVWETDDRTDNMSTGAEVRAQMKHYGTDPGSVAPHGYECHNRVELDPDLRTQCRALNDEWLHPRERTNPTWSRPTRQEPLARKKLSVVEFLNARPDVDLWATTGGAEAQALVVDFLRDHAGHATDRDALFCGAPITSLPNDDYGNTLNAEHHAAVPLRRFDAMTRIHRERGLDVDVFEDGEAMTFHDVIGLDPTRPVRSGRDRARSDAGIEELIKLRDRLLVLLRPRALQKIRAGTMPAFKREPGQRALEPETQFTLDVCMCQGIIVDGREVLRLQELPTAVTVARLAVCIFARKLTLDAYEKTIKRVEAVMAPGAYLGKAGRPGGTEEYYLLRDQRTIVRDGEFTAQLEQIPRRVSRSS